MLEGLEVVVLDKEVGNEEGNSVELAAGNGDGDFPGAGLEVGDGED